MPFSEETFIPLLVDKRLVPLDQLLVEAVPGALGGEFKGLGVEVVPLPASPLVERLDILSAEWRPGSLGERAGNPNNLGDLVGPEGLVIATDLLKLEEF